MRGEKTSLARSHRRTQRQLASRELASSFFRRPSSFPQGCPVTADVFHWWPIARFRRWSAISDGAGCREYVSRDFLRGKKVIIDSHSILIRVFRYSTNLLVRRFFMKRLHAGSDRFSPPPPPESRMLVCIV